ncbi:manganese/zinc/iron transport system substrate-binding protein [Kordia periserrulae]|uniref:Manganese/zinc/iron transport system substrate-binding protein n=1 Tax=Kordia periserrulae TaxID=701523 RepID=A0A2T6C755_9FLAO|nr:zinc ABC transporter substrate-binding protein [Kordia periserrulae]PTX64132.1 manganese/zinc/iron transport system substrate-binding protein [Kordia periserrulae]
MKKYIYILFLVSIVTSCTTATKKQNGKLQIVTTTTMITDMVKNIGGDVVEVKGLMGSGVDPHLYKASEGDVSKLFNADVIIYNGLHLEGKLEDVFEKMRKQQKQTIAVANAIDKSGLIGSEYFASSYDPHIWFHIGYWKQATQFVIDELKKIDAKNAATFEKNGQVYLAKLDTLAAEISDEITVLPIEKRILVTAHDAFNYFGKLHNFEVVGLQGLSTATEAGVQDVQKLATFIIENNVKAIFVESSVPKRTIEALQASVKASGHEVAIGGTLYSDALGDAGTKEGTYVGMYRYNVKTIVEALK